MVKKAVTVKLPKVVVDTGVMEVDSEITGKCTFGKYSNFDRTCDSKTKNGMCIYKGGCAYCD